MEPAALRPRFADLPGAVRGAAGFLDRAAAARGAAYVNAEGGDVGMHGSLRSVARHVAHYLAAAELAEARGLAGRATLDVGSGVGALAAWTADRLGSPLHLADHDDAVLAVAREAFDVTTSSDVDGRTAALVTAMEVLEHLPHRHHDGFVRTLWGAVEPGGLLVLSTPDETPYPGGWSGYAPHIGCVDPLRLRALLARATGATPVVWRLEGAPFALPWYRGAAEAVLNRAWGWLHARAPQVAARLGSGASAVAPAPAALAGRGVPDDVRAVDPATGRGTGMLGIVARPRA